MAQSENARTRRQTTQVEVLLVYKKSKLALYRERKNERFKVLEARGDALLESLVAAHEAHTATLKSVKKALSTARVPFRTCYRARLSEADTRGRLIVTVGGDGTLLDASHRITEAAVFGVNSDPERSMGFLCAARKETFAEIFGEVLEGRLRATQVARLSGTLDGAPLRFPILNEVLVAEKNPAATVRYILSVAGRAERQKSSGIWIAAPAGSTATIASAGGAVQDLDDDRMQLRVREPYIADGEVPELLSLFIPKDHDVEVVSRMREGMLYLDGPHQKVPFPLGARLRLHARGTPLSLYVTEEMRARRNVLREKHRRGVPSPREI